MRKVTCHKCDTTVDEANEAWDRARKTGTCPACGALYDRVREHEAQTLASDPKLRSRTTRARLVALFVGAVLLVAAPLTRSIWIGGLAAVELAFAFLYRPTDAARLALQRKTDLDRFGHR